MIKEFPTKNFAKSKSPNTCVIRDLAWPLSTRHRLQHCLVKTLGCHHLGKAIHQMEVPVFKCFLFVRKLTSHSVNECDLFFHTGQTPRLQLSVFPSSPAMGPIWKLKKYFFFSSWLIHYVMNLVCFFSLKFYLIFLSFSVHSHVQRHGLGGTSWSRHTNLSPRIAGFHAPKIHLPLQKCWIMNRLLPRALTAVSII